MATTVRRRVLAGVAAWVGGLGAAVAVAHPESCPAPSATAARTAVADAVEWIAANQAPDGRFLYRFDRARRTVLPGYSVVRHAGTLLALEQASAEGVADTAGAADRATEWAVGQLTALPNGRAALTAETGGTALLVAALVERRQVGRSSVDDDLLRRLGRFLRGTVTADGAVVATWDLAADRGIEGSRSPFFTGEVMWALARLHTVLPDEGWDEPVRRISHYLVHGRDDAERRFPPVSDHWASYAFAEIAAWPPGVGTASPMLSADERAYARRQAGLFGVQARFESQRRSRGVVRLTRGPHALPAGIATVGEGLGGMLRTTTEQAEVGLDAAVVADRLVCVAGMLTARQAHAADQRVDGAWFRGSVTQVDDQQHAISALLAALPVLEQRS